MECKDLNNDKASLDLKSSLQEMTFSDDEFMAFPDVMKAELLKADNECAWRAVNYKVVANAFLNDNRIRYKADFQATTWHERYSYDLQNAYELAFVLHNGVWYAAAMSAAAG